MRVSPMIVRVRVTANDFQTGLGDKCSETKQEGDSPEVSVGG